VSSRSASRQRPLLQSREQAIGVSGRRLAARTKKSLAALRRTISALFLPWQEIDESVNGAVDELLLAFDKFEERINGSVEWLKEPEES
jgi:hypothetical protein